MSDLVSDSPNTGDELGVAAPGSPAPAPSVSERSRGVAAILCLLLGPLGVHRFYVGKVWTGLLIILTVGGFLGIWPVIDLIVILLGRFRDKHRRRLRNW